LFYHLRRPGTQNVIARFALKFEEPLKNSSLELKYYTIMKSRGTYTDIIFDLGNVIMNLDIPRSEQLFFDLTGIHFMDASDDDLKMFYQFETGLVSEAIFLNYFIGKSKNSIQANDLVHAWNAMLVNIPWPRLEMMQKLKQQYRISILSNTNDTHLRWLGRYLRDNYQLEDLSPFADHLFYSNEIHYRKPDHQIYHYVLDVLGTKGETCLFFDDYPNNVEAAKAVGIEAIIVRPEDDIEDIIHSHINIDG
jgi:putative hydrolase of the HAD superfamily